MNTPHPLYLAALAADEQYAAVCQAHGGTRWTVKHQYQIPAIRDARQAKYAADEAWLAYMRQDSEERTARRTA